MPTAEGSSERDREAAEILADIRRGVRELGANALRIAAGAGKPEEILTRVTWLAGAIDAYQEVSGRRPSPEVVAEALRKDADFKALAKMTELQMRHEVAMNLVEVGALRLAAARIVGQSVQSSLALSTLRDGIHALITLRREADARYAETRRATALTASDVTRAPAAAKRMPARKPKPEKPKS